MGIRNLALAASMALAISCFAQGAPGGGQTQNVKFKVDKFFAEVNTSKSGKITKEEWKAAGLLDSVFTIFDSKNQGYLTLDELEENTYPADIDTDKTGVLTVAKLKAFIAKATAGGPPPGGAGGGAPGGGGPGGGAPPSGGAPGGGGPPQQ